MRLLCWLGFHPGWDYQVPHKWNGLVLSNGCGIEKANIRICKGCGKKQFLYHFLDYSIWLNMKQKSK